MIPTNLSLTTEKVLLRPMEANDFPSFVALTNDKDTWQYFTLDLSDEKQLKLWMETAFSERERNLRRPFTIIEKESGQIAGSMSIGNISIHDRRAEIGWSWLGRDYRGSGINRHSKFAMMRYCFDELGWERVEFKTDVLNARARKGLENIGAKAEGILRSHMHMWNNRRRDSIYYSVIRKEWPEVKRTCFKDLSI